ncbi:MAG: Lrp/AsnC family transcriptional regulator [Mailhella sp.]|nr:Lrp/AsnC family transcriptional regulator [Mailhella sp.]MBR4424054.1 Lrp/AsnC family transcriptional regulator [Mailhella sp.]
MANAPEADRTDKQILDIIQSGFPVDPDPYAVLSGEMKSRFGVEISPDEILERVKAMRQSRLIRRIGANFQSAKLGFRSTLCAAKVPEEKLGSFIEAVNALPGVTHNYQRMHEYNVWFTLIAPSWQDALDTLAGLEERTGVKVLNLPAEKLFKIKVDFALSDE